MLCHPPAGRCEHRPIQIGFEPISRRKIRPAARCSSSLAAGRTSYTARRTGRTGPDCRWAGRRAAETQRSSGRGFAADPAGFGRRSCWAPCSRRCGLRPGRGCCCPGPGWPARRSSATGRCARSGRYRSGCSGLPHKIRCGCSWPRRAVRGFPGRWCRSGVPRRRCCNTLSLIHI